MKDSLGFGVGVGLVALVAIAALAFVVYRNRQLLNPASSENLANQGAGAIVRELTGGADAGGEESLGGALARFREWASGDDARIRAMLKGATPAPAPRPWYESMGVAP